MKKKLIALSAVFVVFLGLGLWFNLQQGLYLNDQFWRRTEPYSYSCRQNRIHYSPDAGYVLRLASKELTAALSVPEEGRFRIDFSDGIAVEMADDRLFYASVGSLVYSGDAQYIITDVDSGLLRFAQAQQRVYEDILDPEGRKVGEISYLPTEDGLLLLDFREEYYGGAEPSYPERTTRLMEDGTRLRADELHNTLFRNAQGAYLTDTDGIAMLEMQPNIYSSRSGVAALMRSIAENAAARRGDPVMVFLYVLLYAMGAVGFLFPEKMAFWGQRWKYRDEPGLSEAGLLAAHISNAVVMGFAILFLFIGL